MSQRAPPLPQAQQPAGTYTYQETANLTAQSQSAGPNHLTAAADYITQLFQTEGIPHALMGGFSLQLRGSPRNTFDVDIAVGCDMGQLIAVLSSQDRYIDLSFDPLGYY